MNWIELNWKISLQLGAMCYIDDGSWFEYKGSRVQSLRGAYILEQGVLATFDPGVLKKYICTALRDIIDVLSAIEKWNIIIIIIKWVPSIAGVIIITDPFNRKSSIMTDEAIYSG